jgi:hypothetical protein
MEGRIVVRRMAIVLTAVAAALMLAAGTAAASSNSQDVISATGVPASGTVPSASGFWIWSQPNVNAYGDNGAGSLYFYAISGQEEAVDVSDVQVTPGTQPGTGTISEEVTGVTGPFSKLNCSFSATETSPGIGTIEFSCSFVVTKTGTSYTEVSGTTRTESPVPGQVIISTAA